MNKDKLLFIIINIMISILLSILFSNFTIFIINLIFLFILQIFLLKCDKKIYKNLMIIYLISIIAMLLLYYGYIIKYGEPYYLGGSDDKNFELWATESIELNNYTIKDIIETKKFKYYNCNGFIWLMSLLIRFSNIFDGYHTIIIRMINIYFAMYTGILVYRYFSKNEKVLSNNIKIMYLVCLFPNALYITIHGFRDAVYAFIIFSVFYISNFIKEYNIMKKIFSILYILYSIYIIYYIRKVGVLYIILIIIFSTIFKEFKLTEKKSFFKFIGLAAIMVIICFKSGLIFETGNYLDRYNGYILSGDNGLSTFIFTMPILPFGIFLRIIYGLIFPSPTGILISNFDVDSIWKFIISIGTLYQTYMLPYVFKNIKRFDKVFLLYLIIFFSIVVTTFSFRHFLTLYPFMFILIYRVKQHCSLVERRKYDFIVTSFLLIFIAIYFIAKL